MHVYCASTVHTHEHPFTMICGRVLRVCNASMYVGSYNYYKNLHTKFYQNLITNKIGQKFEICHQIFENSSKISKSNILGSEIIYDKNLHAKCYENQMKTFNFLK